MTPLWQAQECFGVELVERLLPGRGPDDLLGPAQVAAIAERAPGAFWTDGQTLWAFEAWARQACPDPTRLTPLAALQRFGFEALRRARARGAVQLG